MGLADKFFSVESGGNPNAKNPNSTATGAGQFIEATWLDTLAKHRPDITGSRDELLALRTNKDLSREMTDAYAADNGGILKGAGLPVTPGTQYLAHFAGPKGAVGLLNADPAAPAGSVLGAAAVKANPFLAKMTAGDVAAWADRKMGGASAPMSMAGPRARRGACVDAGAGSGCCGSGGCGNLRRAGGEGAGFPNRRLGRRPGNGSRRARRNAATYKPFAASP